MEIGVIDNIWLTDHNEYTYKEVCTYISKVNEWNWSLQFAAQWLVKLMFMLCALQSIISIVHHNDYLSGIVETTSDCHFSHSLAEQTDFHGPPYQFTTECWSGIFTSCIQYCIAHEQKSFFLLLFTTDQTDKVIVINMHKITLADAFKAKNETCKTNKFPWASIQIHNLLKWHFHFMYPIFFWSWRETSIYFLLLFTVYYKVTITNYGQLISNVFKTDLISTLHAILRFVRMVIGVLTVGSLYIMNVHMMKFIAYSLYMHSLVKKKEAFLSCYQQSNTQKK